MSKKDIEILMTDGASYNAGQVGENRAVELFIHIPKDMYNLEHYYRLVFSNGVVTPMLKISPPKNEGEDGIIQYFLESALTSASSLSMQLEEYGEDELIDKSSIVTLKFGNSLSKPKEIFFNKDIIEEINQNTIYRHNHPNLDLLNSITPEDLGGGGGGGLNREEIEQIVHDWYDNFGRGYVENYAASKEDFVELDGLVAEHQKDIENLYDGVGNIQNYVDEKIYWVEHELLLKDYYSKLEINQILGTYITDVSELIDENLELLGGEADE